MNAFSAPKINNEPAAEKPILQTEGEQYVEPPVFPEDTPADKGPEMVFGEQAAGGDNIYQTQQTANEQQQTYGGQAGQNAGGSYQNTGNNYQNAGGSGGGYNNNNKSSFSDMTNNFKNHTGSASLVISIIALALVVIFGLVGTCSGGYAVAIIFVVIGLVLSIVGLVRSSRERKEYGTASGYSNAAFVLSLIALILGVVLLIIGISCLACIGCAVCTGLSNLSGYTN